MRQFLLMCHRLASSFHLMSNYRGRMAIENKFHRKLFGNKGFSLLKLALSKIVVLLTNHLVLVPLMHLAKLNKNLGKRTPRTFEGLRMNDRFSIEKRKIVPSNVAAAKAHWITSI